MMCLKNFFTKVMLLYGWIFNTEIWRMVQHGHCQIWTEIDMSRLGVDEKSGKIINKWVASEKEHE